MVILARMAEIQANFVTEICTKKGRDIDIPTKPLEVT